MKMAGICIRIMNENLLPILFNAPHEFRCALHL